MENVYAPSNDRKIIETGEKEGPNRAQTKKMA